MGGNGETTVEVILIVQMRDDGGLGWSQWEQSVWGYSSKVEPRGFC